MSLSSAVVDCGRNPRHRALRPARSKFRPRRLVVGDGNWTAFLTFVLQAAESDQ